MASLADGIRAQRNSHRPALRAKALIVEKRARIHELGLFSALGGKPVELRLDIGKSLVQLGAVVVIGIIGAIVCAIGSLFN